MVITVDTVAITIAAPRGVVARATALSSRRSSLDSSATCLRSRSRVAVLPSPEHSRAALAVRAAGLVEGGPQPVVLVARAEGSEELGKRAVPAGACTVGRSPDRRLPYLRIPAAK
jgi:hypothetical protein